MIKNIKKLALLGIFLVSAPQTFASLITNGGFGNTGSCNLGDWQQYGEVITSESLGECSAELSLLEGYEAELSQIIVFALDTDYTLKVNFESTFNGGLSDDFFSIGLINADWDFVDLLSVNILTTQSFSESLIITAAELANYTNQDWTLSFYLYDELLEQKNNGSSISINNSLLEAAATDVSEPSSLAILAIGFAGLMSRRKIANELFRKSIINNNFGN